MPFLQISNKAGAKNTGTGLGLVITKALIDRMGGSISVSSAEGALARLQPAVSGMSVRLPFLPDLGSPGAAVTILLPFRTFSGEGTSFVINLPFQLAPPGQTASGGGCFDQAIPEDVPSSAAAAETGLQEADAAAQPQMPPSAPLAQAIRVAVCVRSGSLTAALGRALSADGFEVGLLQPPPEDSTAAHAHRAAGSTGATPQATEAVGPAGPAAPAAWLAAAAEAACGPPGEGPCVLVIDSPFLLALGKHQVRPGFRPCVSAAVGTPVTRRAASLRLCLPTTHRRGPCPRSRVLCLLGGIPSGRRCGSQTWPPCPLQPSRCALELGAVFLLPMRRFLFTSSSARMPAKFVPTALKSLSPPPALQRFFVSKPVKMGPGTQLSRRILAASAGVRCGSLGSLSAADPLDTSAPGSPTKGQGEENSEAQAIAAPLSPAANSVSGGGFGYDPGSAAAAELALAEAAAESAPPSPQLDSSSLASGPADCDIAERLRGLRILVRCPHFAPHQNRPLFLLCAFCTARRTLKIRCVPCSLRKITAQTR